MTTEARRCWQCKEIYPLTVAWFKREAKCSTGYRGVCRPCFNARRRELRAEKRTPSKPRLTNAERHKAYRARKKAAHLARLLGGVNL